MSRPSCGAVCFSFGTRSKLCFAILFLVCAAVLAPAGRADSLHYFKNYFVTGDYAVEGVGLYGKGANGKATGTISMSTNDVPTGADIVAAFLYWQTVESGPAPAAINGQFDGNNIVGEVLGNSAVPPAACGTGGNLLGQGTSARVYRADVLRYLKVDSVNNNVRDVDYPHTVTLPDSGINPAVLPHTQGASLVVVYRVLPPAFALYKAVVIDDGASTMTRNSAVFSTNIGGFYQSLGLGAKMSYIVGNGQPSFDVNLTVNGARPLGVTEDAFVGAQGPHWDNLTFYALNVPFNASSLQTQVTSDNSPVCLSFGAVVTSTVVVNTDGDGILDAWKINGLHLNPGNATSNPPVPATFGGCKDFPPDPCENLPKMGAVLGTIFKPHKDIFVQIDWMQGYDGHIHSPKLAALQAIAAAFTAHKINVHFDVGNRYQQFATAANNYMTVPSASAQGGHLIQESSLQCPNAVVVNVGDCEYDTRDLGYSVLGWKTGIGSIENGYPMLNIPQNFAHDRKDIFHYILLAHALAGPINANTGLPVSPPPSVSGVGDLFGGDAMVTLGLWLTDDPLGCTQDDPTGLIGDSKLCTNQTGTSLVQAGTLMHELGHNLGLHHGGAVDTPNCMVDYPSTMNYLYQTRGLTGAPGDKTGVANGIEHIDYSNGTLLGLNENKLSGTPALGVLPYRMRYYGPATVAEMTANANARANCNGTFPYKGKASVRLETPGTLNLATTIDWSNGTGYGLLSPGLYSDDIDFDGTIGDSVAGGAGFVDHNDWANLNLQQIGGRPDVSGLSVNVGPADISTTDLLGQSVLGQNVLGQNVLGQNVLGQSVLGQNVLGQSVLGQNVLGQNVLGQNVLGQNVLGQNVLGEVDYEEAISSLDATGASTPLVAALSASSGTAYNQVSLTWGPPSLGQIRTYTIWRANLDAGTAPMIAGTVIGPPFLFAFNDPFTDTAASDYGASPNCSNPGPTACFNTNYQYFITATDTNGTTSTPSNIVTAIVYHISVTPVSGQVVYGNAIPDLTSTGATITTLGPATGQLSTTAFSCMFAGPSNPARNAGTYYTSCSGNVTAGPGGIYGVTYEHMGTLTIAQRPLYIDAVANTKLYDSTTTASAVPVVEAVVANVSGLAYSDTVTGLIEAYQSQNVLGTAGSTLTVTGYTVNDGIGGGNYSVTKKTAAGSITPRPLYIDAATNTKLYDSTTSAAALPTVEATVTNVSGLVGTDGVTGVAEAYQSPNVLGTNASTLTVTAYTVNDGNSGKNYSVTATKTAAGTITVRPLYIDATTNAKIYDSTTTASAVPTVETTVTNVSGLVGTDSVTGLAEAYQSPYVLGLNGSTLTVTNYTVNDGNSGKNYSVTATKTAAGTITARPLYIDATTNTKLYDSTTTASAVPTVEATVANASGLVGTDGVTGLVEAYQLPSALGVNGSTLSVSAGYSVNDNNGGNNYSVATKTAAGTITTRPLYIDAATNTKLYDSTTTAAAVPTVEATVANVSGLVSTDGVAGLGEAYQLPSVLGVNGSTLTVTAYTISDGNSGKNYNVMTKTASGTITARPLYIDATTNTKLYDSTTAAGAAPAVEPTVANVSGLVGTDGVISVETYLSSSVMGTNGSTLAVTSYTVTDGNSGNNYGVVTKIALGTITQRPLTIDAEPNTKTYDGTTSAATSPSVELPTSTTGVVGTDSVTPASLTETYASPNVSNNQTLTVSPGYVVNDNNSGGNYTVTLNTAVGVITPATLIVTVTGTSPSFSVGTYAGFQNSDTSSLVVGTLSCTALAPDNGQPQANTPISCSGLAAPNYNIAYSYSYSTENYESNNNAPLTIAVSATETYGGSPVFSLTYSGFVGTDSPANITGTLNCPTNGAGAAVGTALTFTATSPTPICSGLGVTTNSSVTYDTFYVAGTLGTVTPAPLTVVVTSSAGTYTPASSSGFVNGDTYSSLFGNQTPLCTTLSPDFAPTPNTPISCSGLAAPNYAISYSYSYSPENLLGNSTAPLTVYVTGSATGANPAVFTVTTYSGFINGDAPADVAGTPSCVPTTGSNGYQITSCTGLSAPGGYTIFYSPGTVTVQ